MGPRSVLEAIKLGFWDFEPPEVDGEEFDSVDAMPGTPKKLEAMAERVAQGLPLWHEEDRDDMDSAPPRKKPR